MDNYILGVILAVVIVTSPMWGILVIDAVCAMVAKAPRFARGGLKQRKGKG